MGRVTKHQLNVYLYVAKDDMVCYMADVGFCEIMSDGLVKDKQGHEQGMKGPPCTGRLG